MPAKNIMKNKNNIAIIDYGMGNLFSVKLACDYAGLNSIITSDKHTIIKSNAVILPGVGAFGDAIDSLKRLDLISPIKDIIARKTDFLGICLGLQLLMSESEEFGSFKGLDIIEGTVKKFPTESKTKYKVKVPQVGWNQIYYPEPHDISYWSNSPLKSISIKILFSQKQPMKTQNIVQEYLRKILQHFSFTLKKVLLKVLKFIKTGLTH